ncbi:hypothetical protein FD35_GL002679 [Furfurilactobacillus rossiae DSM 15814]|uniref:HTH cro/C1-type domain-containing protein n=2 Tax=Furfurilactobacillus rossiae TaxID=231049 RepID=A0A0R1RL23_9LACO|nr:hypothetical protein FD35_GL002679 [Furfurilactobacillus rossiae DSM 15814]
MQDFLKYHRQQHRLTLSQVTDLLHAQYGVKISIASLARFEDSSKELTIPAKTFIALCDIYQLDLDSVATSWLATFKN